MGSHWNFKNFGDAPPGQSNGGKAAGSFPLARQPSVYSLTFDELQNTLSGVGKDFGSMNMDELLKNIWSAEETQVMTSSAGGGGDGTVPDGNLQRQGSLTLPRTLSQKRVDEVWRDLLKETDNAYGGVSGVVGGSNLQQRQQTLGEMTLEEFLVRAGVVREGIQPVGKPPNSGFYGEVSQAVNNNSTGLALGFQQPSRNDGLVGNRIMETNSSVPNPSHSLALNVGGRSTQQQPQRLHQHQSQQQPLFPKATNVAFASPMHLLKNPQLASPGAKGSVVGMADPSLNNNLVQGGGTGGVTVATGSPANQLSPDVFTNNNIDTSSLSPVPYVFSRGRRASGALDKVVERRQRRMIKNRESAARSRARKQAYTMELEAEVAKLKELNEQLQKKQADIMEMQQNQIMETMNRPWGSKRRNLRRTLTGPW